MIVTGFVDLSLYDSRRTRPAQEYLARAGWLLQSLVPALVFSDLYLAGPASQCHPANFCSIRDEGRVRAALASGNQSIGWDPHKDTPAYFCLMRHKIEWLVRATELVGASCYRWLDFGYRNLPEDDVWDLLRHAPPPGKIRLAELSYVPEAVRRCREDFYASHWWPVAGGVIAAAAPELLWLRTEIEHEWQWALENGYAVTDEMMLGFIRYRHPERFDVYYADHPTLVTNYLAPRASHDLIRFMAERARSDGNLAECEERLRCLRDAQECDHVG